MLTKEQVINELLLKSIQVHCIGEPRDQWTNICVYAKPYIGRLLKMLRLYALESGTKKTLSMRMSVEKKSANWERWNESHANR